MKQIGTLFLAALLATVAACSGEDDDSAKKGPGEACETDSECENGPCVVDSDGSKACAQSDDEEGGGW